jgi:hypothetical protein
MQTERPRTLSRKPVSAVLLTGLLCLAGVSNAAEVLDATCEVSVDEPGATVTSVSCAIRQDMGFVTIRRGDGVVHDLRPAGDKPGLYMDQYGGSAYGRPLPEGNGFLFRFTDESVEIRWDDRGL